MFRRLWFYIICWKHRNDTRYEFFEQYTLILKAARRCGYDLNHAAGDTSKQQEFYYDRAAGWLDIFSPTGAKDYRHRLHLDIFELESKVRRLQKLCDENGIKHDADDIPF